MSQMQDLVQRLVSLADRLPEPEINDNLDYHLPDGLSPSETDAYLDLLALVDELATAVREVTVQADMAALRDRRRETPTA